MRIHVIPDNDNPVTLATATAPLEVIKTVAPKERYEIGRSCFTNTTGKKILLCKLDCSIPVPVREDHAVIINPEFSARRKALLDEALGFINDYSGTKAIQLPTGETALDFDDAFLILRQSDGVPVLRNKREQHSREKGHEPGDVFEDVPITKSQDSEFICMYADELFHTIKRT